MKRRSEQAAVSAADGQSMAAADQRGGAAMVTWSTTATVARATGWRVEIVSEATSVEAIATHEANTTLPLWMRLLMVVGVDRLT